MSILAKFRDLSPRERVELIEEMPPKARRELQEIALTTTAHLPWVPNPGPQTLAYRCEADELFYGGQAGGGKTSLALGLAITQHRRTLILRRINKDATKLVEHLSDLVGHRNGYNGQQQRWRLEVGAIERTIEFGGCEYEDDKQRYKGDPHDFIYFDEGSDFLASQYRFIIGWNRSTVAGQRCRVIVGSNPPTSAEGLWVIRHWAAWLDHLHPNPAKPGELRWYIVGADGEDVEVDGPGEYPINGETFQARSRTFIPAELADNPDQNTASYRGVLAGLPPELRDAYRDGKFRASLKDNEFQVIPTAWIEAAQERWSAGGGVGIPMTAIGVDVAQGGDDKTVLAPRRGGWYEPLIRRPGKDTRDGASVASEVVRVRRNDCPVVVDIGGGWGGATVEKLKENGIPVFGFDGSAGSIETTRDGRLRFANKRAAAHWRMREELDPDQEFGSSIALPPDASIKADLSAARWTLTPKGILVESKQQIKKRLGRSPDDGDAIIMSLSEGSRAAARLQNERRRGGGLPERANVGHADFKRRF